MSQTESLGARDTNANEIIVDSLKPPSGRAIAADLNPSSSRRTLAGVAVTSFVLIAVPGAECAVHDQPGATMGRRGASAHGWNVRAASTVIKLVGAAYLIYLGVQGIRPAAAPGDHL